MISRNQFDLKNKGVGSFFQTFFINGIEWQIMFVNPNHNKLRRSDGSITIGMTDGKTNTVYLNNRLYGKLLERVLCHEICHCICFSYDIKMSIEQEEIIAEWVSLYGRKVINLLDDLLT